MQGSACHPATLGILPGFVGPGGSLGSWRACVYGCVDAWLLGWVIGRFRTHVGVLGVQVVMSEDPCLTDENLQRSSLLMQEPSIDLAVVGLPHNLMKSSKPTLDARTLGGCGGESGKSRTHSEVEFWLDGAAAKGLASRGSVETSEGSFCLPKCLAGGVEASSPKPLAVGTNIVEGPAAGRNMDEGEEKIKAGGQGDLRSKDRKFTKGDSSSLSNESLVGIKVCGSAVGERSHTWCWHAHMRLCTIVYVHEGEGGVEFLLLSQCVLDGDSQGLISFAKSQG